MPEQSPVDTLVATFVGAALFTAVIAGTALGYRPSETPLSLHRAQQTPNLAAAKQLARVRPTSFTAQQSASATTTPAATPFAEPTSTPTAQPTATPTSAPTPTAEATATLPQPRDHYWFQRPIPETGRNVVSQFYAYGSTYSGRYQVHHGVEFENPTGTPVLAAGSGQIVVAGADDREAYGPATDFYGLLVVIEHDRTFHGRPIFTLYGHLSTVRVAVGETVDAGQIIGEVGATGIALGPHLHMEIRLGENSYAATRNPELWIEPFLNYGTIAGRLLDADGNPVPGATISLFDSQGNWRRDTESYGEGANPDAGWQENFVFGDVPAGAYSVQYVTDEAAYEEAVSVVAGSTELVILQIPK